MHYRKLRNAEWGLIGERFKQKLSAPKAKHLFYGVGRCYSIQPSVVHLQLRCPFTSHDFFWQGVRGFPGEGRQLWGSLRLGLAAWRREMAQGKGEGGGQRGREIGKGAIALLLLRLD